jgi:hypothetical protein
MVLPMKLLLRYSMRGMISKSGEEAGSKWVCM